MPAWATQAQGRRGDPAPRRAVVDCRSISGWFEFFAPLRFPQSLLILLQTSAQIYGMLLWTNTRTKNNQPMGKCIGKSVNISTSTTLAFKTAGGPDCQPIKPNAYGSSPLRTMLTSVRRLTRYLRSPGSGME